MNILIRVDFLINARSEENVNGDEAQVSLMWINGRLWAPQVNIISDLELAFDQSCSVGPRGHRRVRKERGSRSSGTAGGCGREGSAARCSDLCGVCITAQWSGERRDHSQGAGLPASAELCQWLLRQEGTASFYSRSAAI